MLLCIKIQALVSSSTLSINIIFELQIYSYFSQRFLCSIYQVYIGSQMVSEEIPLNLKM